MQKFYNMRDLASLNPNSNPNQHEVKVIILKISLDIGKKHKLQIVWKSVDK